MLHPGTKLGPYEVVSSLGAGGMGEVYRARDTRLNRAVAIKILPGAFSSDRERLSRFEREAQILASLNHPHIAQIHGIEESGGVRALVMELVDGEDLSQRIARGAMPIDEALPIARQMADALEAAHEQGIVHRDLKPANIKVRPNGTVKVLDFGLAKALDPEPGLRTDPALSPTLTAPTQSGVILGTAAYMSPEQARGKPVDKRCDIWAFGCVLFEMLTGKQAFAGETVTDVLAAVVHHDPDWAALPSGTSPAIVRLLKRCLHKDALQRLRDIGDARIDLHQDAAEQPGGESRSRSLNRTPLIVTAVVAALGGAAASWAIFKPVPAPARIHSFTIPDAGFNSIAPAAISRDGRWLAYVPNVQAPPFRLFVRSLDSFESREIASSTASALNPFFSPDGQWIAFFDERGLVRVPVTGGSPQLLASLPAPQVSVGTWGPGDTIVVSAVTVGQSGRRVLARVPAAGGVAPEILAQGAGDEAYLEPVFLPDGRTVLFTIQTPQSSAIAAIPLDGGTPRVVLPNARSPHFSSTGHLLFMRPGAAEILAVKFDPSSLAISGEPAPIATAVTSLEWASFAVADAGTLIYSSAQDGAEREGFTVVTVDMAGAETPLIQQNAAWAQPRISPDGRTVVVRGISNPYCDLWRFDSMRGTRTRLSFDADHHDPLWHPNGQQIAFSRQSGGTRQIYVARADRLNDARLVAEGPHERVPESWSRDGSRLAFVEVHPSTKADIWVVSVSDGQARPFLATRFTEGQPAFSPDGRWLAYVSDESGRTEVYVQPADGSEGRLQISADGGQGPIWAPGGGEIYYAEGSRMMAVAIAFRGAPEASRPRALFRGGYVWERARNYDLTPDGQRFVMVRRADGANPVATLRVILNWPALLR